MLVGSERDGEAGVQWYGRVLGTIRKDDNRIGSCGGWQANKSCVLGANEATLSSAINNKGGGGAILVTTQSER